MVESSWWSLLAAIGSLLERTNDPTVLKVSPLLPSYLLTVFSTAHFRSAQTILRLYHVFTHVCGVTSLAQPRDALLTSLCRHTLPLVGDRRMSDDDLPQLAEAAVMTPKNVLVMNALFNIAYRLGTLLGSSWYLLLKNFQQLDMLLYPMSPNQQAIKGANEETTQALSVRMGSSFYFFLFLLFRFSIPHFFASSCPCRT